MVATKIWVERVVWVSLIIGILRVSHQKNTQNCHVETVAKKKILLTKFNRTSYPGRFKKEVYPNTSITVQFATNPKATPYNTSCAPGLTCMFSDKSWHEVKWVSNVFFPDVSKRPNNVIISVESPGHPYHMKNLRKNSHHAGVASVDLNSDIPTFGFDLQPKRLLQPKSKDIKNWRILHVASNCDDNSIQSNRQDLIEALMDRGLVDSYGPCHHNKDWNSTHMYPPKSPGVKMSLISQYAFVTAFENSYYPGYISEKLYQPLMGGTLALYLGAPNAKLLFPENSFIDVNDFVSYDDLADYVEFLIENRDEYDRYHAFRAMNLSSELEEIWKFAQLDINCRLCRWGAENLF